MISQFNNHMFTTTNLQEQFDAVNNAFLIKVCELLDAPQTIFAQSKTKEVLKREVTKQTKAELDTLCKETTAQRIQLGKEMGHTVNENWCREVINLHFKLKISKTKKS